MFKGTHTCRRRILQAYRGGGARMPLPAMTTRYFQQLHKSKLPLAMKLESDRMHNLNLTPPIFPRKSGSSWKSAACAQTTRRMRCCMKNDGDGLPATPYQHPYRLDERSGITCVGDAKAWYSRWYAPNNATLSSQRRQSRRSICAGAAPLWCNSQARIVPQRKFVELKQQASNALW